jgi:lauroyl/myristoyl acyltransferase
MTDIAREPAATPRPTESKTPVPLRTHAHAGWTRHVLNSGAIFTATYKGVSMLPRWLSYGLGDSGAWIAHRLLTGTTNGLIDNFRAVFPTESDDALRRLAARTYRTYARDVVDFIRALTLDPDRARALFSTDASVTADAGGGVRPKIEMLLGQGKGVILVSGHFGNWEIGSVMLRAYGIPLTIIAMQEPSETVNRLRHDFRERVGVDTLEVRQSMDTALQIRRRLADNRVVAMLMDRHVDRDRVAVTFFGRRAFFLRTPALLGYLTGAPLLPCAIVRRDGQPYEVIAGDPIFVSREGNRDASVAAAAQAFATQLEALIRRTPHCWYQFYPYWAAQQEGS